VFGAAIDLGVALLAAEALDLGDGQPSDPDLGERVAHVLQLERLDDGGDQLHGSSLRLASLVPPEPKLREPSASGRAVWRCRDAVCPDYRQDRQILSGE